MESEFLISTVQKLLLIFHFPLFVLCLFSVRHHAHKASALYRVFQHFLVLKADTGVVPLHNVTEVVDERLHSRVVLPVDVLGSAITERASFVSWVGAAFGFLSHGSSRGSGIKYRDRRQK